MMAKLLRDGEIYLFGFVSPVTFGDFEFSAGEVVEALVEHGPGPVSVNINSYGGSAIEGAAIRSVLAKHDGEINVKIHGLAASAASLVAMAGDNVAIAADAIFMIHEPSAVALGTAGDMREQAGILDKLAASYAAPYAARTGKSQEEIRAMMAAETYMTADEAVADGFADSVVEIEKQQATAAMIWNKTAYNESSTALRAVASAAGWLNPKSGAMPDPAASAARKEGGNAMASPKQKEAGSPAPKAEINTDHGEHGIEDVNMVQKSEANDAAAKAAADAAVKQERARSSAIRRAAMAVGFDAAMTDQMIDDGLTLDQARAKILDALATETDKNAPKPASMSVTTDGADRFRDGVTLALMAKAGIDGGERNEYSSMSLQELARRSVEASGSRAQMTSKFDVVSAAFQPMMSAGSHSTSDFANVLANVANKAMLRGFDEQDETFGAWTSTGSLPDFKTSKLVGLTMFPALDKIAEDAEYKYGTIGDYGEPAVLATYGDIFRITRQAIINDDLRSFTRIPEKMGRAASRTVGDLAYAVLTGNPTMSDGTALFHANHGNLAGSGAAPSITTLEAAMTAMATQTDRTASATALNIRPAYIIAPYALRGTINQLLESEHDPAKTSRAANTVRNAVEPIYDARLDQDSTTAWYLAAAPNAADTVEVSYLDGNSAPFMESKDGWSADGVEYKVRIDAAATPLAWEGLYKNPGV